MEEKFGDIRKDLKRLDSCEKSLRVISESVDGIIKRMDEEQWHETRSQQGDDSTVDEKLEKMLGKLWHQNQEFLDSMSKNIGECNCKKDYESLKQWTERLEQKMSNSVKHYLQEKTVLEEMVMQMYRVLHYTAEQLDEQKHREKWIYETIDGYGKKISDNQDSIDELYEKNSGNEEWIADLYTKIHEQYNSIVEKVKAYQPGQQSSLNTTADLEKRFADLKADVKEFIDQQLMLQKRTIDQYVAQKLDSWRHQSRNTIEALESQFEEAKQLLDKKNEDFQASQKDVIDGKLSEFDTIVNNSVGKLTLDFYNNLDELKAAIRQVDELKATTRQNNGLYAALNNLTQRTATLEGKTTELQDKTLDLDNNLRNRMIELMSGNRRLSDKLKTLEGKVVKKDAKIRSGEKSNEGDAAYKDALDDFDHHGEAAQTDSGPESGIGRGKKPEP